jgi:hypothetical protein
MGISTPAIRTVAKAEAAWLRSRDWDLTWISLSVILVALPYITYLIILNLGFVVQPLANLFGASPDSISRNIINAAVALGRGHWPGLLQPFVVADDLLFLGVNSCFAPDNLHHGSIQP